MPRSSDPPASKDLQSILLSQSLPAMAPDGRPYRSLPAAAGMAIAEQAGLTLREVEVLALEADIIPERYARNFFSFDTAGQVRLLSSSAAVIGLGGLGGYVLEILVRTGVGRIVAADGDIFAESNLNRQILCTAETLCLPKARAAAERAACLNPAVEVITVEEYVDEAHLARLLTGLGVVVDCLGGLKDRLMLQRAAAAARVPLVTAAVAGWAGYAAVVRPGDPGPADIMGGSGVEGPAGGAEERLGCLAPGVALAASLEASQAIQVLLGQDAPLIGKMLFFDLADATFESLTLGSGNGSGKY